MLCVVIIESSLFLKEYSTFHIYQNLSIEKCLSCFQFETIINNTTIKKKSLY